MEKYFLIIDDCGWRYYIKTDNPDIANLDLLLMPHVRSAKELTREDFEQSVYDDQRGGGSDAAL